MEIALPDIRDSYPTERTKMSKAKNVFRRYEVDWDHPITLKSHLTFLRVNTTTGYVGTLRYLVDALERLVKTEL